MFAICSIIHNPPIPHSSSLPHTAPPTLTHTNGLDTVYMRNSAPSVSLSLSIRDAKPSVVANQIQWSFVPADQSGTQVIDLDEARYSSVLTGTGDDTVLMLTIQDLILADSGVYNVSITHSAGTVMLQLQLLVLSKYYQEYIKFFKRIILSYMYVNIYLCAQMLSVM